jgi:hypothetical protein
MPLKTKQKVAQTKPLPRKKDNYQVPKCFKKMF